MPSPRAAAHFQTSVISCALVTRRRAWPTIRHRSRWRDTPRAPGLAQPVRAPHTGDARFKSGAPGNGGELRFNVRRGERMAEHRHRWEVDSLDDAHQAPDRSECDCDFYAWVDSLEGQTVAYVMNDGGKIPVIMGGRFKPDDDAPSIDMHVDEDVRVIGA